MNNTGTKKVSIMK